MAVLSTVTGDPPAASAFADSPVSPVLIAQTVRSFDGAAISGLAPPSAGLQRRPPDEALESRASRSFPGLRWSSPFFVRRHEQAISDFGLPVRSPVAASDRGGPRPTKHEETS